jgi:hypothetical protein
VITLAQSSSFQNDLKEALSAPVPRDSLVAASEKYIRSDKFISSVDGNEFQKQIVRISAIIDKLEEAEILDSNFVSKAVKDVLGEELSKVVASVDFVSLYKQLTDSIIAIKYVEVCRSLGLSNSVLTQGRKSILAHWLILLTNSRTWISLARPRTIPNQ